jgi:hypothetical protein
MVKDGAVVCRGITRVWLIFFPKGYIITGDGDFENVSKKASFITSARRCRADETSNVNEKHLASSRK